MHSIRGCMTFTAQSVASSRSRAPSLGQAKGGHCPCLGSAEYGRAPSGPGGQQGAAPAVREQEVMALWPATSPVGRPLCAAWRSAGGVVAGRLTQFP